MANSIHVLNGDSTALLFEKSALPGEVVVWREMCCEGPLAADIDSDNFWKKRYEFFEEEYEVSKLEYFDNTLKELLKLTDIPKNHEIVLWFEYDLFCQFNLLAACSLLLQYFRKDLSYYLICVGKEQGSNEMKSLGDFSPDAFAELNDQKRKLTRHDLEYAKSCWEVLVKNELHEIEAFDFGKSYKFMYFKKAIEQHLDRFPDAKGLNKIDYKILEIIDKKAQKIPEIVRELLIWQAETTWFGFGDLQYFTYIKKLQKYYYPENYLYFLNKSGKHLIYNNGRK